MAVANPALNILDANQFIIIRSAWRVFAGSQQEIKADDEIVSNVVAGPTTKWEGHPKVSTRRQIGL